MQRKEIKTAVMIAVLVITVALMANLPTIKTSGTICIGANGSTDPPTAPIQENVVSLLSVPSCTGWNKTYGGSDFEQAFSVEQTSDGGYIIAGYGPSYVTNSYDFWLVKTDASGNQQWNKTYGGSGSDGAFSVQQTSDGGYIIAGHTTSFGAGSYDFWLVKTDASGNQQWNKTYGGSGSDEAFSVQQTSDGGYIVAGYTSSFGAGSYDFWLVKTDGSGNQEWNKTYGGSGSDGARSVEQTSDGGYIIAGFGPYGAGGCHLWLVKTDASGNRQWDKTYGGGGSDGAYSVEQTSDGGYIIAGYTTSYAAGYCAFWLVKTDASGNQQWDKAYGGSGDDEAFSVQQTSDGGYIIAGYTSSYGAGSYDFWLIKVCPPICRSASENVVFVPSDSSPHGGTLPTTDPAFATFSFDTMAWADVNTANLAPYDTVVLMINMPTVPLNASQEADLIDWVQGGGKIIMYDSETVPSGNYSWLPYPMTTINPGAMGYSSGNITFVENNTLGCTEPTNSTYCINTTIVPTGGWEDGVGDCNIFVTFDPHWFGHIKAENYYSYPPSPGYNGTPAGWVHTYAPYGDGLFIYNGFDIDPLWSGSVPNSTVLWDGNLAKIWLLELKQPWGTYYNLPGTTPASYIGDVAVTGVVPSKTVVSQGSSLNINVIAANQGNYTETFDVTLYANTTVIGTQAVNNMLNGTSTVLTFTWNTGGFATGNYTISAYASPVPGETDTADNTLVDGSVLVTSATSVSPCGMATAADSAPVAVVSMALLVAWARKRRGRGQEYT